MDPAARGARCLLGFCISLLACSSLLSAWAADPPGPALHQKIDAHIAAGSVGPSAAICSDADFVRRVWIDLAGMSPPVEETRAFLADSSADKRGRLIDRLLDSPQFARHMTLVFDNVLMERRADKAVKTPEWRQYLFDSFVSRKPLDKLYEELVAADETVIPATKFFLDRDCEPNIVTRDIGRMVFGMDLQCAQCHDHPLVDDYYQADYYGIYAFVFRTSLFTDAKTKKVQISEKADGEANYKSVFTSVSDDRVRPRLPKWVSLVEPNVEKGKEYITTPTKDQRGVPAVSRRKLLAQMIEPSDAFRRNIANRVWSILLGRGLVHPVDNHHPANPPVHPQVLTLLTEELVARNYDLRSLLKEIARTEAYQRSVEPPAWDAAYAEQLDAEAESLDNSLSHLAAERDRLHESHLATQAKVKTARESVAKFAQTLAPQTAALAKAEEAVAKAQAEVAKAEAAHKARQEQSVLVTAAAARANAAVRKVTDDKILADAAAKITERAAAIEKELPVLAKKAADLAAAVPPLSKAAEDAKSALAKASAEGAKAPQQIVDLEKVEAAALRDSLAAQYALADAKKRLALLTTMQEYRAALKADPVAADRLWNSLVDQLTARGQIAPLKHLSAEQFALSAMQGSGLTTVQIAAVESAVLKQPPEKLKTALEADKPAAFELAFEQTLFDRLAPLMNSFVQLYDGLPGQDFQATVAQSLFFGNAGLVDGWLKPSAGNLVDRANKATDSFTVADELYLGLLCRPPTQVERQAVADFLASREADRPAAIAEMAWGLLSSSEFRFNH